MQVITEEVSPGRLTKMDVVERHTGAIVDAANMISDSVGGTLKVSGSSIASSPLPMPGRTPIRVPPDSL